MSENPTQAVEIRRIRRMLRETARMAKEASLTHSLEKGVRTSVAQYNHIVQHLEKLGAVPTGFFPPLPDDAVFDDVGVASAQLASYLHEEEEEPRGPHGPGHGPGSGNGNVHVNIGGLRDLKDLKELKELGQIIREQLPDWMRGKMPSTPPTPPGGPHSHEAGLSDLESRLAEVGAKLQTVAEQLRRGDLSDEQRASLADQLSRLGQEQARLAREHGAARAEVQTPPDPPRPPFATREF